MNPSIGSEPATQAMGAVLDTPISPFVIGPAHTRNGLSHRRKI